MTRRDKGVYLAGIFVHFYIITLTAGVKFYTETQRKEYRPILKHEEGYHLKQESEWKAYRSNTNRVSVNYPQEATLKDKEDGLEIVLKGETQKTNQAFAYGIAVKIKRVRLFGDSLKEVAENYRLAALKKNIDTEINVDLVGNNIRGSKEGYFFSIEDRTRREIIFMPTSQPDSFFLIVNSTSDPYFMGYQEAVDSILNSLQ